MLDESLPVNLPDSGAPPLYHPARLWLYGVTQWRRLFGLNLSQIDALLFVGGEFRPSQWPAIYAMGVRAVLNLQAEREDRFDGPPPDLVLRLPVEDFHAPTIAQLQAAVAFIATAHAHRWPVLVHCHAGVGRAALTASAYLMTQGLGRVAAFERIKRARPIVALNDIQRARLREWEQFIAR